MAAPLFAAQRTGVHRSGNVHRQFVRRSTTRDVVAPLPAAPPGAARPAAPTHNGTAYWIKVSANPDGTSTVTNSRNQFTKTYGKLASR